MTEKTNRRLSQSVVSPSSTIRNVLEVINQSGLRGAILCDDDFELIGIIMDSDIRRAILRNTDLAASIKTIMKTSVFVLDVNSSDAERRQLLIKSGKLLAPIVDERRRVVDYLAIDEAVRDLACEPSSKPDNDGAFPPSKVLVIGGAGYIGSTLVQHMLESGYNVRVLDLLLYGKQVLKYFEGFQHRDRLEFIRGDCRDEETVRRSLEGIDAVVHLGEIVGDPACQIDESFTIETNYAATQMIIESCMKMSVRRFIFASSCSVYGHNSKEVNEETELNPVSLYARCKVQSERAILSFANNNLFPTILRLATAHGRSYRQRLDLVVNYLTVKALAEGKIQIQGGEQWRPFASVRDICRGILGVLQANSLTVRGHIFNLGDSGENYKLDQIGFLIKNVVPDVKVEVLKDVEDQRTYKVNFDKIKNTLGFTARYPVSDSIQELVLAYDQDELLWDLSDPRYYNSLSLIAFPNPEDTIKLI